MFRGDDTYGGAGLLNLPPGSKDAQVFEQFARQAAAQGTAPSKFVSLHDFSGVVVGKIIVYILMHVVVLLLPVI